MHDDLLQMDSAVQLQVADYNTSLPCLKIKMKKQTLVSSLFLGLLYLPLLVSADCTCDDELLLRRHDSSSRTKALKYKLVAIASILMAGALGVSLPILAKKIPAFRPENNVFFLIKAFAAGVILATAFVHILPDGYESLSSPCLSEKPWGVFPFPGFLAMVSAIATMMIETFATSFFKKSHFNKALPTNGDEEMSGDHEGHVHVHVHTHATHGSAVVPQDSESSHHLIRQRVISQVLEVGIVVHSVIIGMALGASQSAKTIKPLVAALTFHQFFEGMGLGGCISQAKFKSRATAMMLVLFSLTTPMGIALGMGVSKVYNANSPKALVVEGIFNSLSAGILIYMSLVDLLAVDFMNPIMQSNIKLQLGSNLSLLLGAAAILCDDELLLQRHDASNRTKALKYKLVAIAAILMAGALGVSLPMFRPENNVFFLIKAFAAGVILVTAFVFLIKALASARSLGVFSLPRVSCHGFSWQWVSIRNRISTRLAGEWGRGEVEGP
ncbi:hypothetical protein GQ457_18G020740 [Hibiscus cannabinus]